MKAFMLAAGVGRRLYGKQHEEPPKVLLSFEGETLLRRHIRFLKEFGVDELVMVLGYRMDDILAEAAAAGAGGYVRGIYNPRFREGPILSLWTGCEVLRSGEAIVFMDSDVLYSAPLLGRLIGDASENCFVFDRRIDPEEDPVSLCLRGGTPVEFGKGVEGEFDAVGEWPGFLKMSAPIAARVADAAEAFVADGHLGIAYEEAISAVLKSEPPGTFGYVDVSDVPWIEIDFQSDIERAKDIIMPRISDDEDGDGEPLLDRAAGS
jgi:choline kinase